MEENFEKKSGKKVKKILSVIILLLIVATVASFAYLNISRKPEKVFSKAIEDSLEMTEENNATSARIGLEFSLEIDANDAETKAANQIIKALKLKSITEIDLNKKIFNENLSATYDGEQIISADALIQNETVYFYLNELYNKYIKVNEEYIEGIDLSTLFETSQEVASEDLINDIKKILLDEVNSKELTQEKVELDGENVLKSTIRLSPIEVLEISLKVLKKVNEYQPTVELEDLIDELEYEMEYMEETENYVDISIYTKGLMNDIVKSDAVLVNVEDEEVIVFELVKNSDTETVFNFMINEESTKVSGAEKLMEITLNSKEKNKGTVEFKINADEETSISLKIKYDIEYNVNIEERNTSNNIMIDELTEEDLNEILENAQKNELLNSIIQLIMTSMQEEYVY